MEQAIAELKEQSTPSEGEQTKNQIGENEGAWPHEQVILFKGASKNEDFMDQYNPILESKVPELFQTKQDRTSFAKDKLSTKASTRTRKQPANLPENWTANGPIRD